jgi:AI-2 transport protein TqsA
MSERLSQPMLRLLLGLACLVIILWGVRQASHLIVLALLGILLACSFLPLHEWLMNRFKLRKSTAIGWGVTSVGTLCLLTVFSLYEGISRYRVELPAYEKRLMVLYEHVLVFLNAHGVHLAGLSGPMLPSSERMLELSRVVVPGAAGFLSDGLLVTLLSVLFVIAMVEQPGTKRSALGETLRYYGQDMQSYIGVTAKTNAIAALANLVVFLVFGVEFPVLWSALTFFLRFVPNIGFVLALLPPSFLALLVFGWKRALLVAGGQIAISLLVDYVVSPIFMKKVVSISFLEMTVSLVFWGAILGFAGGILAIPLTLTLRRFITEQFPDRDLAKVPAR